MSEVATPTAYHDMGLASLVRLGLSRYANVDRVGEMASASVMHGQASAMLVVVIPKTITLSAHDPSP